MIIFIQIQVTFFNFWHEQKYFCEGVKTSIKKKFAMQILDAFHA